MNKTVDNKGFSLTVFLIVATVVGLAVYSLPKLNKEASRNDNSAQREINESTEEIYLTKEEINESVNDKYRPKNLKSVEEYKIDYLSYNYVAVDGPIGCTLFDRETLRKYGTYSQSSGFGSPSISKKTYYINPNYDKDTILQVIADYC